VCMPSQAEDGQVRDVVVKYLVGHPEKRDLRAAQIVLAALVETWKCPPAPAS
jgi:Rap1a immunity proteins